MKPVLKLESDEEATDEQVEAIRMVKHILCLSIDTGLRAIAPFMPYLAEELYQRLQCHLQEPVVSICVAPYPKEEEVCYKTKLLVKC